MPRHSSIFNFRIFKNAGFWSLILILGIETYRQKPLAAKYQSHEVDKLVHSLDTKSFSAPVLFLGDSVAGNVFHHFVGQPTKFHVFASNQAVEATGQFFILRRYLEKNPDPGLLVYMAGLPFYGDLDQIFTENFIQRIFLDWREIGWMSAHKLNPAFTLKCLAYKFLPSFRFRLQLQDEILGESQSDIYSGTSNSSNSISSSEYYAFTRLLADVWQKVRGKTASERSWQRILELTGERHIPLYFLPTPTLPVKEGIRQTRNTLKNVHQTSKDWPHVRILNEYAMTLPADFFSDGTHLNSKGLESIKPVQTALGEELLRKAKETLLAKQPLNQESMYSMQIREDLDLPAHFILRGVYDLEGIRNQSFRWTQPQFEVEIPAGSSFSSLNLETAPVSPATSLAVEIAGMAAQTISIDAGSQTVRIKLPDSDQSLHLFCQVKGWKPGNQDPRELGIAIASLQGERSHP